MNNYEEIVNKFSQIESDLQDPKIINDPNKLYNLSLQHAELKEQASIAEKIIKTQKEIKEIEQLTREETDNSLLALYKEEIKNASEIIAKNEKIYNELTKNINPDDIRNAIIEIRAGTGGEEAALFAGDLYRMYSRYATDKKSWKIEILSTHYTSTGGIKEIIFEISGKGAFGELKNESGVHRVQRIPETESSGRIHTSAASVVVLPSVDDIPEITINESDIKIDVYRATGPGGQSVNTTDSAVRITHLPTNIVVTCQDEKSQHKNKAKALSVLKSKLYQIQQEEEASKIGDKRQSAIKGGDRSAKIRTYNYPQSRVTDHRIKQTWHNLQSILNGELDQIIKETQEGLIDSN